MSYWGWLTVPGEVGELSVNILEQKRAEPVLDAITGIRVANYDIHTDDSLIPGDVCILTAKIESVSMDPDPTPIEITVHSVEFIQKSDRTDSEVTAMMQHLNDARELREESASDDDCDNCHRIGNTTRLSVETKVGGRDLHYCASCNRLLSSDEYQRWWNLNRE